MKPIITTICLFVSLGTMIFAIWPEYQDLRESMITADAKEQDLENMIAYNQSLKTMINSFNNGYNDKIKKINSGVPEDHYVPSLFSEIRRISYKTGVRIEGVGDFSVAELSDKPNIKEIEINFNLEGDYPNFKSFISELESSTRIISIKNLNIENSRQEESHLLNYAVTLLTYSY
ncbi:MAG: type 4a pilus biogenesis protein PilO [Patescibacteria group bacterium]